MYALKLILRNALRHKLRTTLTLVGIVISVLAFGLLQTVVDAWYAGAEAASDNRLITRNAISLVFPLPINYRDRLKQIEGIKAVSFANWFGGVYITEKNFFPQFAVDAETYFHLYPEYRIAPDEMKAFLRDRRGCIVGRKIATLHGWKVGDVVPLRGTIFPGTWEFIVRGIYDPRDSTTDTALFFFQWEYLNESVKKVAARRANQTGVFVLQIAEPERAAEISQSVDALFKNSLAETLTETEKAFQLGFVSMTEAIVLAIRIVSFLVIFIIMAVMANTMAMSARERHAEYATLKAIGFTPAFLALLIFGESLLIALVGGVLGSLLTFPVADAFVANTGALFHTFNVSGETIAMQLGAAAIIGVVAALVPSVRATRGGIAEGLRAIG